MKSELLVIADQNAAVNAFPGLVHTARHTTGYRFLMGLRVRCRWMPSISNDCPAAADRTDFGAPDFGAVD